jgi:hypothetical protein
MAEKEPKELLFNRSIWAQHPGATPASEIRWIFDNLCVRVGPQDAPSAGAWGYLLAIRADESLKSDFLKSVYPKLLPSKAASEEAERKRDDSAVPLDNVEQALRAVGKPVLPLGAEGCAGEPEISPRPVAAGAR